MGIGFVLIGLALIITGMRDTYAALGTQLRGDFTGQGNFTFWVASIAAVGALGYAPALKTFSHYFMALILLALLLSHQGFFAKLSAALASGPTTAPTGTASTPASPGGTNVSASTVTNGLLNGTTAPAPGQTPSGADNFSSWLKSFGVPSWLANASN